MQRYRKIVKNARILPVFIYICSMEQYDNYINEALGLLQRLIATPSTSRNEAEAADVMQAALRRYGFETHREANNVWVVDPKYDSSRQTILLNAHIDTVKPVNTWTRDPFTSSIEGDRLYGLGSNDCGGGLTTLLQVFRYFCMDHSDSSRPFNFIYLASAEEEISGQNGIGLVLPKLPSVDVAIVGEPTGMQPAIAEKGLMVLDVIAHGVSGHAARNEGVNAIYEALDDMRWIRDFQFPKVSPLLGPVKMTLTMVNAGTQHNVIPDRCTMLVDVRSNELYTNEEIYDIISRNLKSEVLPHSFRLHSSHIDPNHPLVQKCLLLGLVPFGSPTLSDQSLMPFPSLKLGPGESMRSHSADEFIEIGEIQQAFEKYIQLLES